MKRKRFAPALAVLAALLLAGCSAQEPRIQSFVSLAPRTETAAEPLREEDFLPVWPAVCDVITVLALEEDGEVPGVRREPGGATVYLPGVYLVRGRVENYTLCVDLLDDTAPAVLLLDGVDLSSDRAAALYVPRAADCFLLPVPGTENRIAGGAVPNAPDVNAAVWTMGNLTISGGRLAVSGALDNAVSCKDRLVLNGCELDVEAPDDGLSGRDLVGARDCVFRVRTGGDGIKATNLELGRVSLQRCTLDLETGLDGIDGCAGLAMFDCTATFRCGGGHTARERKTDDVPHVYDPLKPSWKGAKSLCFVYLETCTVEADTADDCLHSDGWLTAASCRLTLRSADDGLHANKVLTLRDCVTDVPYCYEGLEGSSVFLSGGETRVVASDDGVNVPSEDGAFVYEGGTCAMVTGGDGIDSNGAIYLKSGLMNVNGPTPDYNGVLDFNLARECVVSGGTYVSTGASGMALAPSTADGANLISVFFPRRILPGEAVTLTGADGRVLISYVAPKPWQNFHFSSPDLAAGETVTVWIGGIPVAGPSVPAFGMPAGAERWAETALKPGVTKLVVPAR